MCCPNIIFIVPDIHLKNDTLAKLMTECAFHSQDLSVFQHIYMQAVQMCPIQLSSIISFAPVGFDMRECVMTKN